MGKYGEFITLDYSYSFSEGRMKMLDPPPDVISDSRKLIEESRRRIEEVTEEVQILNNLIVENRKIINKIDEKEVKE